MEFLVHNSIDENNNTVGVQLGGGVWGYDNDKRWNTIRAFELKIIADYATWELIQTSEDRFADNNDN